MIVSRPGGPGPGNGRSRGCFSAAIATVFRGVLDVAFPWTCAGCGVKSGPGPFCPDCLAEVVPAQSADPDFRAALSYRGPVVGAVRAFKYHDQSWLAPHLARLMPGRNIPAALFDCDCLVPVPLHPVRRRERGFNQAELLARELSALTGLPLAADILSRRRNTPSQTALAPRERAENVAGAFAVPGSALPAPPRCLIVDDVMTSGATMRACAGALRAAGARTVRGLVLARA